MEVTIKTRANVGVLAWIGGVPVVHRGGGRWTTASVTEFGEAYPLEKVPGFSAIIEYRIPNEVPKSGRPLSVGAMAGGRPRL